MAATNWIKRPTESAKKLVKNATGNLNDSQAALANLMDGRKYENLSPEVQKRADDLQASIAVKTRLVQYYTSFQKWVNEGNKVTDTHDPFKDFAKKVGITRNDYIGKSSNIGTADIPGISDIQIKDGVIRTRTGFIPSTEATTAQTAAASGREGEPTTVKQQADGTYSIIGSTTGKILESGIGSSEEALAIQTQRQAGSTPSVSGAANVFAVEPVLDEEKAAVESGEATIATQEQLTGASTPSASTRQIRSVDELNSLASLGLTESDITRQGSAIFLKEGVDETFLTQRGTSGTGTELVEAGAGSAIDSTVVPELGTTTTATAVQSAQAASLFPDRAAILAEQMEALGLGTTSDIAQLQQTIGEGIIGQEKALRELPDIIKKRTEDIGVTQGQLNSLISSEREPIAAALKDLLMSRSLLREELAFSFQQAEFIAEGREKSFDRFTDLLSEVGLALDPTTGSITESFVARESRFDREAEETSASQDAYNDYLAALGLVQNPQTGEISESLEGQLTSAKIAKTSQSRSSSGNFSSDDITSKTKSWANYLAQYTGNDGYVDTGVYRALAEQIGTLDGTEARDDFLESFPAEIYLNPNDPTAQVFFSRKPTIFDTSLSSTSNEGLSSGY